MRSDARSRLEGAHRRPVNDYAMQLPAVESLAPFLHPATQHAYMIAEEVAATCNAKINVETSNWERALHALQQEPAAIDGTFTETI